MASPLEVPRYTVIAPIDRIECGQSCIPAHMKVLPWFSTEAHPLEVDYVIKSAINGLKPFIITGGPEAFISADTERRVRLVGDVAFLRDQHLRVLEKVESLQPIFKNPAHAGESYLPHVSCVSTGQRRWIRRAEQVELSELGIAFRHPSEGKILSRIALAGSYE